MRFQTYLTRSAGLFLVLFALGMPVLAQGSGTPPGPQSPGGPPQGPGGPPRGPGGPNRPNGPGRLGPPPPGPGGRHRPPPPRAQLDFAAAEMLGNRQIVKNAPYSADAVTEMTQVLADGTRITNKTTAAVARDSEGRTRRELKLDAVGPFVTAGGPPLILINDPTARIHYWLNPQDRSARKIITPRDPPPGARGDGPLFAEGEVESLGTKTIEGVSAEGTRSTITIPVGEIGNDRPLQIVSERWYSPDLQTVVMSRHIDPRHGENHYQLTNLKRTEPDASLFQVPKDYQVREERPQGPPPGRRPPPFSNDHPQNRLPDLPESTDRDNNPLQPN